MYTKLTFSDFADAFERKGRGTQFSHDGLRALFDHMEQEEEEIGLPLELDVIALCCEYAEIGEDDLNEECEVIAELSNGSALCRMY